MRLLLLLSLLAAGPSAEATEAAEAAEASATAQVQVAVEAAHANEDQAPGANATEPQEAAGAGRISYRGAQLLRVAAEPGAPQDTLERLLAGGELQLWHERLRLANGSAAADVLVAGERAVRVRERLQASGAAVTVLLADVQEAIDQENTLVTESELDELQGRYGHRMEWQSYHRLEDIQQFLQYLAATYPALCSLRTIGSSAAGRPLHVLHVAADRPGAPAVWVDGGMHAREWVSPAAVTFLLNELVLNREQQCPAAQAVNWYVLPVANPDGYEHSHARDRLWRKNLRHNAGQSCMGVDLNRNFGYMWGGAGSSRRPCDEIYAGSHAFSEPETAAISAFVKSTPDIKAYLSFHSYGQYVLYPWGYGAYVPPDHADLRQLGDSMARAMRAAAGGSAYRVGSSGATLYPASGGSDDWAKGSAGIKYAYTVELRDRGTYGFVLPARYIEPTSREAAAAARAVAEQLATPALRAEQGQEQQGQAVGQTTEQAAGPV